MLPEGSNSCARQTTATTTCFAITVRSSIVDERRIVRHCIDVPEQADAQARWRFERWKELDDWVRDLSANALLR